MSEPEDSRDGDRKQVRRRRLIAAAATLAAMMVAERTAAATAAPGSPVIIDGQNTGSGTTYLESPGDYVLAVTTDSRNSGAYPAAIVGIGRVPNGIGVKGFGFQSGVQGLIDIGQTAANQIAVNGSSYGTGYHTEGVQGLIIGTGPNFGTAADNSIAVEGTNYSTGNGIIGVLGTIANSPTNSLSASTAISGNNYATTGQTNGVYGEAVNGTGVFGFSQTGAGAAGQSNAGHGLVGKTNATDGLHAGLFGYTDKVGAVGIQGTGAVAGSYAGVFNGTTVFKGQMIVQSATKSASVLHPDGSERLLYSIEAPEAWFEDFGSASLVAGRAAVMIDPDFAAVVDLSDYHVFLTEYDDHNDLFVTNRTETGFEVRAKDTTAPSGAFSYRLVARRADLQVERLATFESPRDIAAPAIVERFSVEPGLPPGFTRPSDV